MLEPETTVNYYTDDEDGYAVLSDLEVDKKGQVKVTMQPNGGFILN